MNKLKTILFATLLGLSNCSQSYLKSFNSKDNSKYLVNYTFVDVNNDGSKDYVFAKYDMNKNGKVDTYGMFKITNSTKDTFYANKKATVVGVSKKEDGHINTYYIDEDGNGTLEKKVNEKELQDEINKELEKRKYKNIRKRGIYEI